MWPRIFGIEGKRKRLLRNTSTGALHDFYSEPFPDLNTPIRNASYIVLDFETTGLDLQKDHVISIGLVEIDSLGIKLNTAHHEIIRTDLEVPEQSAVIHQITDDMILEGTGLKAALDGLLERLKGKVLIAHHAQVEFGFLRRLCADIYNQDFVMPVIDTRLLAKRQLLRSQVTLKNDSLRLFNLRDRYKLTAYKAHNALSDALSTAELFLALVSDLYPNLDCRLKDLVVKK